MKRNLRNVIAAVAIFCSGAACAQSDLVLTGVMDGPLTGGTPKGLEIYVINDVSDLSIYGIANANNGGPSLGMPVFTFPADGATAGDFIYLASELPGFEEFLGFPADYNAEGALGVNGDDVIELYLNGAVVDYIGVIEEDGTGMPWEYLDGWAYRLNGNGPSTTFDVAEWTFSGIDALDNETTNATSANPWPNGTYIPVAIAVDATIQEIQETLMPSGASPLLGQEVNTSGLVTAVYSSGFWLQDGVGPWSGVFVRQTDPIVLQGDDVMLSGFVEESNGLTRINNITNVVVNSSSNALPAATSVNTSEAGTEQYESVLISVGNATCFDADLGFGEWLINDGSGDYRVDDVLYDAMPVQFATYNLTGIAYFSFSDFKLLPRDIDDVIEVSGAALALGFETATLSVDETDGTVTITVEVFNPTDMATTVDVAVTGGTAVNGTHFNFTSPTTLTFAANATEVQTFSVEVIDDAVANEDRTIIFTLQDATNDAIVATGELTLTIADDDAVIVITDIATVAALNAEGVAINNGSEFTIDGIVYGVNMNAAGLSFTVIDETGGIGIYSNNPLDDYVVTEGDNVQVTGTVNQFNGLTQLAPTSIELISQGNALNDPTAVTAFTESVESQLIKLECVFIPDPSQWTNGGSGFTVTVSDGENTFAMRIDNDVDLYSAPIPQGTFDVVGIGGQFDNSSPFDSGYQILPRSTADIVSADCGLDQPPVNDLCTSATNVTDLLGGAVGEMQTSAIFTNVAATVGGISPATGYECFGEPDGTGSAPSIESTVWFTFTGDGGSYFIETTNCNGDVTNYIPEGDTQMAIYTGICAIAAPVACNEDGPNATVTFEAGLELATEAGQTYLVMIDGYLGTQGEFCLAFTSLPLANDGCEGAIDLTSLTGGAIGTPSTSTIFSNVGATADGDPNPNDAQAECWFGSPTVQQAVWFSFTGDGSMYFIETLDCGVADYIDDGDSQMAIFAGTCGDLTQVACNEDGPQATDTEYPAGIDFQTTEGVTYYVMIDGYESADGEFCVQFTNQDVDAVRNTNDFVFEMFPNPAKDRLFVIAPEAIQGATLRNVLGQDSREFQFSPSQRLELNISGMAPGIYVLQLRSNTGFATSKIVVE